MPSIDFVSTKNQPFLVGAGQFPLNSGYSIIMLDMDANDYRRRGVMSLCFAADNTPGIGFYLAQYKFKSIWTQGTSIVNTDINGTLRACLFFNEAGVPFRYIF